ANLAERWTGADGVDADGGREALGHRLGHGPQRRLTQGVAEVVGREVENALIDDVDDVALYPPRDLGCEVASEEGGGLQMDREVAVPQFLVEVGGGIRFKGRGVVHQ